MENEGVEMVTPEIMSSLAKMEREIEEKETLIEPSIIQSPTEEKKQSINKIQIKEAY